MKKLLVRFLTVAVIFQCLVLTGMYVKAGIPLWLGQEIKVKVLPVDPRSLLRGNYARLSYDFSRINAEYFNSEETLRNGDVVYISLNVTTEGFYEFSALYREEPIDELFLKGRIAGANFKGGGVASYRINYGIEAFFAPKEKALALERNLRDGAAAVLMVGKNGSARLKDVIDYK